MLLHRATLVAMATLFTAGMTSMASAGCCDWGMSAPVAYASSGCGGCGAVGYAQPMMPAPISVGCGSCGMSSAAVVFAQPAAPVLSSWGNGCNCGRSVVYAAPVAAPSLYVVNQGPEYSGPGLMNPYRTYSRAAAYAPETEYPYLPAYRPHYGHGYGAPFYRPRPIYRPHIVEYRERVYARPHYAPMPRFRPYPYPHRPLGARG